VEYQLSGKAGEPETAPDIFAIGPNDFKKTLEVTRVSPGRYRGRVHIGTAEGLFRVRPLVDSRAFPEVGLYRQESELSEYGSNEALLQSIAKATGGRFNPTVRQLFDAGGRYTDTTVRLWPWLLGLAVLLNLVELGMRKWRGIVDSVRGPKAETRLAA
jgi:hypothetical protein